MCRCISEERQRVEGGNAGWREGGGGRKAGEKRRSGEAKETKEGGKSEKRRVTAGWRERESGPPLGA